MSKFSTGLSSLLAASLCSSLAWGQGDAFRRGPAWFTEGTQLFSHFAYSVSGAGDVNGDGFDDVIVGDHDYENNGTEEGRVEVYYGKKSGLSWVPSWTQASGRAFSNFGVSVSSAGDVNSDGFCDVIIGANTDEVGENLEGRAYVFHGSASGLSATPAWAGESNHPSAFFGLSVAAAGDVNGDGYSDVIVGAPYLDNGENNEGRAYVYHGSATGLEPSPAWTAEPNQQDAQFGRSVSGAGDVNGDGYSDVIISAPLFDNGEEDEGRVYVFLGSASGLETVAAWTVESNEQWARLGTSVATAGDVNADGYSDVIVTRGLYTTFPDYDVVKGIAYVYHGSATGLDATPVWTGESDQQGSRYGAAGTTAGDLNSDGYSDIVISAPYYYFDGQLSRDYGLVYAYYGSTTGLDTVARWTAHGTDPDGQFGYAIAGAGDVNGDSHSDVIISAFKSTGITFPGRAYAYLGCSSEAAVGSTYCDPAPNSTGVAASIRAQGSDCIYCNEFTLVTEDLPPSVPGVYFFGPNQTQAPLGDGFRCVAGSTRRIYPVRFADAQGVLAARFDLRSPQAMGFVLAGMSLNFQLWHRDGAGGPAGFNLSNGLSLIWQ